jgi:hypothetical protein
MTTTPGTPAGAGAGPDGPVDLEGVPEEEDISKADAVDRLDEDPDEQVNRTERES